jgi:hypothetical protein
MKTTADAEYRARRKSLQFQGRIVQKSLRFRIGRLQHLKAVVQNIALNDIGLNPAAHSIGCLYQKVVGPLSLEPAGTAETRKARPDNDHVETLWIHCAFPINHNPDLKIRKGFQFRRDGQQALAISRRLIIIIAIKSWQEKSLWKKFL